jgi:cytochrome c oxidase accessory protein FixG
MAKEGKEQTTENLYQFDDEFRDTIATVDKEGKRIWIYPKKPKGYYHNLRIFVTVVLLSILFAGPFIKINGQPLLLVNIFERKFVVFGATFWPQDFFLLALTLVTFFVFIILFTVSFGRIWCGWACPQTLFMEMVFRKIEYWIEGDANQQRRLDQQEWNSEKIIKKTGKQLIFLFISLLIAHTVMAYLVGIEQTIKIVSQPPTAHLSGFIGLMAFTGIFYFVFAKFREQACTVVCPYGRLQGVLLVKDSIAVMYDWLRGEPRGKISKHKSEEVKGDCIDCKLCVHVCPTGIDIRNGTQLECVNCTACMDVCDDVMVKVGRPEGLIRYASHNMIAEGKKKIFTTRVMGYSVVLFVLLSALSYFIFSRADVEATILRLPGMLYQRTDDGMISNLYNVQIANKTFTDKVIELRLESMPESSLQKVGESAMLVEANGLYKGTIIVKVPGTSVNKTKMTIEIGVYENDIKLETVKTNFLGPVNQN